LQIGFDLLTDDVLALEMRDGVFWGLSGYATMRMWPPEAAHFVDGWDRLQRVHPGEEKRRVPIGADSFGSFCKSARPLKAIYFLDRRDGPDGEAKDGQTEVDRIGLSVGVVELMRMSFTPRIVWAAGLHEQRFLFFSRMVEQVEVRRLRYPTGLDQLPTVREAIVSDLESLG
jgi:hypothetical protein